MVAATVKKETDDEKVHKAKLAFVAALADLSWRLASVFMVPVLVGFFIDKARGSETAVVYGTIVGFVLSVIFIIKLGLEANKK